MEILQRKYHNKFESVDEEIEYFEQYRASLHEFVILETPSGYNSMNGIRISKEIDRIAVHVMLLKTEKQKHEFGIKEEIEPTIGDWGKVG